ncbi:MAG: hypothetical protein BZY88_16065 [SAR202 cluster bacterium Io17-Chloro-G9]|nr:MAG: hypothetical protein BZY88_16065 [SAR202 cluster bacterium Io17-Chloro-G9]
MIKGVFIAFGIMLVCFLIPLVHFVAAPASPFIGGYIGISYARSGSRSPVAKAFTFGALLGGLVLTIAVLASAAVTAVADLGRFFWVLWGGVIILAVYTASMSALGALFSLLKSDSEVHGAGQEPARDPARDPAIEAPTVHTVEN